MTNLEFTDEELKTLCDLVRQTKITATSEELLAVTLGKASSPLLAVVYKIMSSWQTCESKLSNLDTEKPVE